MDRQGRTVSRSASYRSSPPSTRNHYNHRFQMPHHPLIYVVLVYRHRSRSRMYHGVELAGAYLSPSAASDGVAAVRDSLIAKPTTKLFKSFHVEGMEGYRVEQEDRSWAAVWMASIPVLDMVSKGQDWKGVYSGSSGPAMADHRKEHGCPCLVGLPHACGADTRTDSLDT